ncbi:terpenoid synthase [Daedalea quercina L-15889]|uniref:Terpenoid synthase n=1 Tax=Daedalea quercina L-15889 TaxID=1314783 RepID=A0A165MZ03_9APHY|nr:terpenoid synthase [Daedalea quercina L-15889]
MTVSSVLPTSRSISSQASKPTHGHNVSSISVGSVSKNAVVTLLQRLQIDIPSYTRDRALERRAADNIRQWGPDLSALLKPYLPPAIVLTMTCYSHIADPEARLRIVLFSTLVIALDDPKIFDASGCRDFHRRLCCGQFHRAGELRGDVLARLMEVLSGMWKSYPGFSAGTVFSAVLQFINGCMLERMDGICCRAVHPPDALPFITYRRAMSGLADAFSYFIWTKAGSSDIASYIQAIPDISSFQNHANDILSFYKEELAGETGNYVSDRAKACGKTREETLQEIVDETVLLVARIRRGLGDGPVRDAWESFARGWLAFHVCSPRYRLRELINCEYVVIESL